MTLIKSELLPYDSSNNITSVTGPDGTSSSSTFDTKGNSLSNTNALGFTSSNVYDANSRITSTTDPLNRTTSYAYSAADNMTSVTDPRGKISTTAYNANGLVTSSTDSTGRSASFGYDANANQTSVTVTNGGSQYVTNIAYNTAGQPTSRTDATGRITNNAYDAWGRLLQQAFPTSGRTSVSMSYDANGNLTTATDATGSRSFLYDLWNRRLSLSDPRGNTSATYDASGNILSQSDVSGRTISNVFDGAGQISSVTDGNGTGSLTYNAKGQIATLAYPNGVIATYAYDNGGRATGLTHKKANNTLLIGYAATYDNAGRLSQIVETPSNDVTTYSYDNADRLLSEVRTGTKPYSGNYTYDDAGRRLSALVITNGVTTHNGAYSYDGAGRLQQVVDSATSLTENYVWNADGTLASYPGPGYTRLLEYDEEGRLVRIKRNTGGTITTAYKYGYGYDGGRRWRKDYLQNQWTWYPCGVACSAGELVEQQSDLTGATWTTVASYLRVGSRCSSQIITRGGETHHFDLSGAAGVITNSSGTIISSNLYDAFSATRFTSGTAATPWRNGDHYQAEEGMIANCFIIADRDLAIYAMCEKNDSACSRQKSGGDPTICQDCCDEKVIGWIKGKGKGGTKKALQCLQKCLKDGRGQEDYIKGCLKDCLDAGSVIGSAGAIKNFLECCYTACDGNPKFQPPGKCNFKNKKNTATF